MKCGMFNNNEYIITNMRPVRPLKNYLWSEHVVAHVDQIGQGRALASINKNRRTFVKSKRIFYLKDGNEIYSPNRNFSDLPFDIYECHAGLGYQTIISEYKSIRTEMTIIVPRNDYAELVRIRVKNNSNENALLKGYYYCDLDANLTEHWAYGKASYDENFNGLVYYHNHFQKPDNYMMMYAKTNLPVLSWDVSDANFFGTYGNELMPDGIKGENLSCEGTVFEEFYSVGLQVELSLKPGETKDFIIIVGIEENVKKAQHVAGKYITPEKFENEYNIQLTNNSNQFGVFQCETPDEYFNVMTNIWTKRQLSLGKEWGRVYGKGFRDVMQDITAFVSLDSVAAKKQIINALEHQYESGNAIRMFEPDFKYPYMDMPAWIPATVLQYIKETGDVYILGEEVDYLDSSLRESIFMHIKRGVDFLINNVGEHGLPLWGGGDWNDSMNNAGIQMKGESVWLAIATVKAINEFIEILEIIKEHHLISEYEKLKNSLVEAINKYGWDGDHYIYGYSDSGTKVGSDENEEGKIYLNPQTWAILAGIKKGEEGLRLLDIVEARLKCNYGYLQNVPAYTKGIDELGRSTYFIPGLIENASVYNHGVAFKIVADCMLGRAEQAYNTFKMMCYDNPLNENNGVEPYAFSKAPTRFWCGF